MEAVVETPKPMWERYGFTACLALLFVFQIILGFLGLPAWVTIISGILFISLPIGALFCAASSKWTAGKGFLWLGFGVVTQVLCTLGARMIGPGAAQIFFEAGAQLGLIFWCAGLGALVGVLIKDKNMILPVAIFLAGFDIFLVMTPNTFISATVEKNPQLLQSVALRIPAARTETGTPGKALPPRIQPVAFVGPADLIFVMTFFVLLFRFEMKVKETLRWLVPILVLYMAMALSPTFLGMLPALVPIGLTVLIVNRDQFKLAKDEKLGVILVAVIASGLAIYGITARIRSKPKAKPAVPYKQAPGQEAPALPTKPAPASSD